MTLDLALLVPGIGLQVRFTSGYAIREMKICVGSGIKNLSFLGFYYKTYNLVYSHGDIQGNVCERFVTQLCIHFWVGGTPRLLASPK
jgi:hypothetical protein